RRVLLDRFDKSALPAADWLRRGWPRALPVALLFLLPSLVAGPVRAVTGVDLNLAFVFAIPLVVAAVWPFRRALALPVEDRRRALIANAVPLLLAAAAVYFLYNRDFAGLYGFQDDGGNVAIDGAVHSLTAHSFQTESAGLYEGFVSLYSFWFMI